MAGPGPVAGTRHPRLESGRGLWDSASRNPTRLTLPSLCPPGIAAVHLPGFRDSLGFPCGDSEPQPEDTTDESRMDRAVAPACPGAGVDLVAKREAKADGCSIVYHFAFRSSARQYIRPFGIVTMSRAVEVVSFVSRRRSWPGSRPHRSPQCSLTRTKSARSRMQNPAMRTWPRIIPPSERRILVSEVARLGIAGL